MTKRNLLFVALFLHLALATGAVSFFVRQKPVTEAAVLQRDAWLSFKGRQLQSDASPLLRVWSTRVLMPALMASVVAVTGMTWPQAFSITRLLSILCAYYIFYLYLRRHFSGAEALMGLLFLSATIPLTFNNYFEIPNDFPEIIIFSLGVMCVLEGWRWLLCLVILIGTFNRETTCFLPLILLFVEWPKRLSWAFLFRIAPAGLCWLIPFVFLHWWVRVGDRLIYWDPLYWDPLSHNLSGLTRFFSNFNPYNNYLFYLYLFGILWAAPLLLWKSQPPKFRRALLTVPLITVVYLFLGYMDEPREIVPLYALLTPAGLYALRGLSGKTDAYSVDGGDHRFGRLTEKCGTGSGI
jgi:hypothetical protein